MSIARRADRKVEELEAEIEEMMKAELEAASASNKEEVRVVETEEIENQSTVAEPVTSEERTYKKRYGDLRRHQQKIENELKSKISELENQLKERPTPVPTTPDQIKEWARNNPQATAIIRAIAREQAGIEKEEVKVKFEELEEIKTSINRSKADAKVRLTHPDFDIIINDDKFHDWAESQPSFVQDKIYDNLSAEDTIWAISLYKKENGIKTTTPEKEAARTTGKTSSPTPSPDRGRGRFTESVVAKMSAEEFEKNWAEIEKEMRNPAFYDISGGAR